MYYSTILSMFLYELVKVLICTVLITNCTDAVTQSDRMGINSHRIATITFEPRHVKTCLREFPTRPDSNWHAQLQKLASLEISAIESRDIILSKQRTTKAQISLRECAG